MSTTGSGIAPEGKVPGRPAEGEKIAREGHVPEDTDTSAPQRPASAVRAPHGSTLRRSFVWMLLGRVVYSGCQWGVLVALARLADPATVGRFALGLAVAAPVFMLWDLKLRAVQATDAKNEYRFSEYLSLRLLTTPAALLVVGGIALLAGHGGDTVLVVLAVAAAKAVESVSNVFYGLFQKHERMDRIAISLMLRGPASLAVMALTIYATGSLFWAVVALAVARASVLGGFDVLNGARILQSPESGSLGGLCPSWDYRRLARLAWLAFPLGVVMMFMSLNANIPRYFVERHCGETTLGFFAAIAYPLVAGSVLVGALGQAASPRLAKYYVTNMRAFRWLLMRLLAMGGAIGIVGVLLVVVFGNHILTLLYGPDYAEYSREFSWLAAAATIGYVASILGYGLTATRHFRIQGAIGVVAMAASLGASALLIPSLGLLGATLAVGSIRVAQLVTISMVLAGILRSRKAQLRGRAQ